MAGYYNESLIENVAHAIVARPHPVTREWAIRWLSGSRDAEAAKAAYDAAREASLPPGGGVEMVASMAARAANAALDLERTVVDRHMHIASYETCRRTSHSIRRQVEEILSRGWVGAPAPPTGALDRARAILAGEFPAEQFDAPY